MRRMKLIICILSVTLVGILLLSTVSSNGQDEQKKEVWKGVLENGTAITKEDLLRILEEHRIWLNTDNSEGKKADLRGANLSGAFLSDANLRRANLSVVNLASADLFWADLRETNLSETFLSDANLSGADLSYANLSYADLRRADLSDTDLRDADLSNADLSDANLTGAYLSGAELGKTNLSGADLSDADLSKAGLFDTNLKDVIFLDVNLMGATYEPISAPNKGSLGRLEGLTTIKFNKGKQSGLVLLRATLKDAGLRNLERETTYTIEHWKTNYAHWSQKWPKRLLFEWTCGYGLHYLRPLLILFCLFVAFSIPYIVSLSRQKKDGIWIEWVSNRMRKDLGQNEPYRLKSLSFMNAMGNGIYFSVLSAFHIGWRDLNVGSWIARIQPREYTLKATGWVRVVSGIQSLISIYLLALWVLTQFSRPFG